MRPNVKKLVVDERGAIALEMSRAGNTLAKIGAHFGVGGQQAKKYVEAGLRLEREEKLGGRTRLDPRCRHALTMEFCHSLPGIERIGESANAERVVLFAAFLLGLFDDKSKLLSIPLLGRKSIGILIDTLRYYDLPLPIWACDTPEEKLRSYMSKPGMQDHARKLLGQ